MRAKRMMALPAKLASRAERPAMFGQELIDFFLDALADYGPAALGLALLVGNMGLPTPTTPLVLASGALAREGLVNWQMAAVLGFAGAILGDVISYALFPQVARPFLERRKNGGGGKEALVAAIATLFVQQYERRPAAAAKKPDAAVSPWKMSWRPQQGRWGGLIDGAGGTR